MYSKLGRHTYARIDLESQIAGATPHQLITMLFDGALNSMLCAKIYFEKGNVAKRGEMLSKAINIIDNGLIPSLNHDVGQQIAQELAMLYGHVAQTLLEANMNNSVEKIPQAIEILSGIAATWKEIEPNKKQANHG